MDFTYKAYRNLLQSIADHRYFFCGYNDWQDKEKCVILRHDIDNDIAKALTLARIEWEVGIKSTYFVLVTSDFYNIFSSESERMLKGIVEYGHEIGLHFDEVRYSDIQAPEDAREKIQSEARLLSSAAGTMVKTVSMHRPSKMMLDADLEIPGIINSYGKLFFKGFKYVSDSRRRWREPVDEIVASEEYNRLHILTHAIWYHDTERDLHDSVAEFINAGNRARYEAEKANITDLASIMAESEIR